VLRPQQPLTGLQAALVVGLRLLVVALVAIETGQIADGGEGVGVLRTQQPLTGLQAAGVIVLLLFLVALYLKSTSLIEVVLSF